MVWILAVGHFTTSLVWWVGGWVGAGGMGVKTKPSPAKLKFWLSISLLFWPGGWVVALEEWKVRLTQPPAKAKLASWG